MKTILVLFLILICMNQNVFGGSVTYKSKVADDWYSMITVNMQGSVAKVIREQYKGGEGVKQSIYNTTNLEWNNGEMTFPDTGIYWFIPFSNNSPYRMLEKICTECQNQYVCSAGSCDWQPTGNDCFVCDCGSGSTNPCITVQKPCFSSGIGGVNRIAGGGVIIQASSVMLQQVFYSKLVNSDKYCKISVQYENNGFVYCSRSLLESIDFPIGQAVYNYTDIPWIENTITIPLKGRYWYIPFETGVPQEVENGDKWCYSCNQTSGSTGCLDFSTCDFRPSAGNRACMCANGNASSCTVTRCPCNGTGGGTISITGYPGGGIFLSAEGIGY